MNTTNSIFSNEILDVYGENSTPEILIVDDEVMIYHMLKATLSRNGYKCTYSPTGESALKLIQDGSVIPDLLLIDIMMPDMNGLSLTKKLKSHYRSKNIPIILVTGLSDRDTVIRGLNAGAEEYITKPVDQIEIVMRAKNLIKLKRYTDILNNKTKFLESLIRKRTLDLSNSRLDIVRSLSRAAEYRSLSDNMHTTRIGMLSYFMAKQYGLNEDFSRLILQASPMYDIGKVAVPDNILLKNETLTNEEWNIMKSHTTIGYEILKSEFDSDLMECARKIALSHHEKWNGTGYPHNLSKDKIPVEARIVSIVDVFDSLTNIRSYSPAWSSEKALGEILNQREISFDPDIVDVLQSNFNEFCTIQSEYKESNFGKLAS